MRHVLLAFPFLAVAVVILVRPGRALRALSLGEDAAESLGFAVGRTRAARRRRRGDRGRGRGRGRRRDRLRRPRRAPPRPPLRRPRSGSHPPSSALAGAALLFAADIAVRLIPSAVEVKIGVLTALLGVPVFLWIVARRQAGFAEAPRDGVCGPRLVRPARPPRVLAGIDLALEPGCLPSWSARTAPARPRFCARSPASCAPSGAVRLGDRAARRPVARRAGPAHRLSAAGRRRRLARAGPGRRGARAPAPWREARDSARGGPRAPSRQRSATSASPGFEDRPVTRSPAASGRGRCSPGRSRRKRPCSSPTSPSRRSIRATNSLALDVLRSRAAPARRSSP